MRPSLDERLRDLLPRLHALSEAEGASVVAYTSNRQYDHQDPKGAQPERKGAPDPEDSLLAWLLWKLERARSENARLCAVAEAEVRLERRVRRHEGREAGSFLIGPVGDDFMKEQVEERDRRIGEDYPGLVPEEVAAIESESYGWVTPANVRRCRFMRKRDPETGGVATDSKDTVAYARQLQAAGHSMRSIALRLGVSKSTVSRWLSEPRGRAA